MTLSILGMGHSLPGHEITNAFLHEKVGLEKNLDWVGSRLGIDRRFSVLSNEYILETKNRQPAEAISHARRGGMTPVGMGVAAAWMACERAGIRPERIGWVIANDDTPFETIPPTAVQIARELGVQGGPHCDINSACSSFARHLQALSDMQEAALPDYVLAVQTGAYTVRTDYASHSVDGYIWGDGAAAQVLSARHPGHLKVRPVLFQTDPRGASEIIIDSVGHFSQNGGKVRSFSVRRSCRILEEVAEVLGFALSGAWTVTHQANAVMQDSVVEHLHLPRERHLSNVREQGNIAAAGCPSVISQNWDRFRRGDRIAYAVVGAGLAWGGGCLEVE
jgi:3-oxoacyl-[acyl-carrier-protein] synthase III